MLWWRRWDERTHEPHKPEAAHGGLAFAAMAAGQQPQDRAMERGLRRARLCDPACGHFNERILRMAEGCCPRLHAALGLGSAGGDNLCLVSRRAHQLPILKGRANDHLNTARHWVTVFLRVRAALRGSRCRETRC